MQDLHSHLNALILIINLDRPVTDVCDKLMSLRVARRHNTCIWLAASTNDTIDIKSKLTALSEQTSSVADLKHIVESECVNFEILKELSQTYSVTQVEHIGFD